MQASNTKPQPPATKNSGAHCKSRYKTRSAFLLLPLLALLALLAAWKPPASHLYLSMPNALAVPLVNQSDATRSAHTADWETDHRATQDTGGAGQDETLVAVNPHNPDNAIVVAKDYRGGEGNVRNYIDTTTDGGATWQEQPFPLAGPDAPHYSDPTVYFRGDGRAYITWMGFSAFGSGGLFISWSDDGGLTWSPATTVTPATGHYDDKEWLTFDATGVPRNGTMYMAWVRFGNSEIYVASSTDGGATWSDPVQISQGDYAINDQDPRPVVLPDGTLVVMFLNNISPGDPGTLIITKSTDGGATFGPNNPVITVQQPPFTLPGENWRIFTFPSLGLDPVRGWLTLVWNDYRDSASNGLDILYSRSTDSGATWTSPARLNDDPPGLVRDQWFPEIAYAPDGRLTAVWLDRRDDPGNRQYLAYSRTSLDGGITWQPSVAISSVPCDPNVGIPPGSDGIGDYIGISAAQGVVWASWVDNRNGDQDIYAAREQFTPQPPPSPTATPYYTPTPALATATATTPPAPSATPCRISFNDVPQNAYFYEPVQALFCRGVISGYPDNTFRPYTNTTRGQAVKIVVLANNLQYSGQGEQFADVAPDSPFYRYIVTASGLSIVGGVPCGGAGEPCNAERQPYFRPGNTVSRGQIAKIVALAARWILLEPAQATFSDVPPGSPFYTYVETAASHGVLGGYACGHPEPCDPANRPYFRPANPATRGQIATIVYNSLPRP